MPLGVFCFSGVLLPVYIDISRGKEVSQQYPGYTGTMGEAEMLLFSYFGR